MQGSGGEKRNFIDEKIPEAEMSVSGFFILYEVKIQKIKYNYYKKIIK